MLEAGCVGCFGVNVRDSDFKNLEMSVIKEYLLTIIYAYVLNIVVNKKLNVGKIHTYIK